MIKTNNKVQRTFLRLRQMGMNQKDPDVWVMAIHYRPDSVRNDGEKKINTNVK